MASLIEKVGCSGIIGAGIGAVGATVATIWGGYEIGTALNDAIKLEPTIARGLVDLVVMCGVAGPAYAVGIWGGLGAGVMAGGITHYITSYFKKKNN